MTHAWLFTGPPGSGRSVAARAFAAALQCPDHGCGDRGGVGGRGRGAERLRSADGIRVGPRSRRVGRCGGGRAVAGGRVSTSGDADGGRIGGRPREGRGHGGLGGRGGWQQWGETDGDPLGDLVGRAVGVDDHVPVRLGRRHVREEPSHPHVFLTRQPGRRRSSIDRGAVEQHRHVRSSRPVAHTARSSSSSGPTPSVATPNWASGTARNRSATTSAPAASAGRTTRSTWSARIAAAANARARDPDSDASRNAAVHRSRSAAPPSSATTVWPSARSRWASRAAWSAASSRADSFDRHQQAGAPARLTPTERGQQVGQHRGGAPVVHLAVGDRADGCGDETAREHHESRAVDRDPGRSCAGPPARR